MIPLPSARYIPSDDSNEMDPVATNAARNASLLIVATMVSVMILIGLVAILQSCKKRHVRNIVYPASSVTTLPYYQDVALEEVALPPPAYFPIETRRYREVTRTSGEMETIDMKALSHM